MTPTFDSLNLPSKLSLAIKQMKFTEPTPIQAASIPIVLEGHDLIACAQTGTGKTAAFVIPALVQIMNNPAKKVLVLTPTRELASQIVDVFRELTRFLPDIRGALLIGGASMGKQINSLSKDPHVIIATPGRLNDHLDRGGLDLGSFGMIVLDEADRMLDMGFLYQVEQILEYLPPTRQTMLFSATLAPAIRKLADRYIKNPKFIQIGENHRPLEKIKQSHILVDGKDKNEKILQVLAEREGPVLIFARTKIRTDRLSKYLKTNSLKVAAIHGGRTQRQREDALDGFKDGQYRVLVATDVASRGIDVANIELVINFDLPETREDYIHRIGRTARGGATGEALSFVTPDENSHWKMLTATKESSAGSSPRPRRTFGNNQNQKRGGGNNGQKPRGFQRSSRSQGRNTQGRSFGPKNNRGNERRA